ncbi:MAG: hypothetical protein HY737_08860 [Candidatus Omnitrophica bacterium]|nr:hypothetical protein [Candidatus Omnitrophota bacterium]
METSRSNKRIGEILMERGLVTRRQLELALEHQRITGQFLGATLIDLGFINSKILLETLSEQFRIPHEPLSEGRVDWEAVKKFPASLLASGKCFPVRADAATVTIALANPLDVEAVSQAEKFAGLRQVKLVLVLERELREVVRAYQQRILRSLSSQLKSHGSL